MSQKPSTQFTVPIFSQAMNFARAQNKKIRQGLLKKTFCCFTERNVKLEIKTNRFLICKVLLRQVPALFFNTVFL